MNLTEKTVLVTGSTRGIGLAVAQAFRDAGAKVILHGRTQPSADVLALFPAETNVVLGDIADAAQIQATLAEVLAQGVEIDVLVNNAGIVDDQLAMGMAPEQFARVVDTNLNGTFNVTQPIFKTMLKRRTGVILNMTSVVGLMGNMGQSNYAASKAGLVGLTKSLAKEGARRGVRVNAIAPGMIVSDMTDKLSERVREQIAQTIPLKHFGAVQDIAQTAVFLAENDYITGQTLTVDGGLSM